MKSLTNNDVLLHISLISGIGPAGLQGLLATMAKSPLTTGPERVAVLKALDLSTWYDYSVSDFVARGVRPAIAQVLVTGLADVAMRDRELDLIARHEVDWVAFGDENYPTLLHEIHAPPVGLYVRGNLAPDVGIRLGVVGSRLAGSYAQQVIQTVVGPCVSAGWQIVSGGALGVDGMAHALAVAHQQPTIVVLGSGLTELYPYEHKSLFQKVIETGGALISPFPMTRTPDTKTFPMRNRIIAGLSHALLVVQAAERSGALISAQYALEEGRLVAAIPGPITDPLSAGCHGLIKQGAALIASAKDLFHELGQSLPEADAEEQQLTFLPARLVRPRIQREFTQAAVIGESHTPRELADPLCAFLHKPISIEELEIKSGISLQELEERLFELHLAGHVEQLVNGAWQISNP